MMWYYAFVCTQLNRSDIEKIKIFLFDFVKSGPGSNGIEALGIEPHH